MKTITTLFIVAATSFSVSASAGVFISSTYEYSDEEYQYTEPGAALFSENTVAISEHSSNQLSLIDETVDEEYKYNDSISEQSIAGMLNEMDANPPAASGKQPSELSYFNQTSDEEYQHQ
jgi:hypothetical protein